MGFSILSKDTSTGGPEKTGIEPPILGLVDDMLSLLSSRWLCGSRLHDRAQEKQVKKRDVGNESEYPQKAQEYLLNLIHDAASRDKML